jgi:hypothetical protein
MSKPSHTFDEKLWRKILTAKQVQGLAWKIERAIQVGGEGCALVKTLVEKWAELENVRHYFPDLEDVFTPDAMFRIEYASRQERLRGDQSDYNLNRSAGRVYYVLAYISNLVARHEITIGQLRRLYNNCVSRWVESETALPLFDTGEVEDGRLSANKQIFIPQGVEESRPKKRTRAGTKTARIIERYYTAVEPTFSIKDGELRISIQSKGGQP